jgi:ABC-type nitrate/sulfonate/bicarbonate transport system substrate-binding protein
MREWSVLAFPVGKIRRIIGCAGNGVMLHTIGLACRVRIRRCAGGASINGSSAAVMSDWRWLLLAATILLALSGANEVRAGNAVVQPGSPELHELRYQGLYGSVTMPELAADLGYLAPVQLKWIGNTFSGPQDIQACVTGDVDYGGAFNGSIAKLIAAGAPIRAVIGSNGSDRIAFSGLYVLDSSAIHTARDLIDRKVGVNTLGAAVEFSLDNYLQRGGLSTAQISDVTLAVMPPSAQEQALRQGVIDGAMMSGIFRDRALSRGGLRRLFTDHELFGDLTNGSYVLTLPFMQRYPNTARKFVEATARAIDWVQTHSRDEVVARFVSIIKKRGRPEDPSLVTFWKSSGIGPRGGHLSDRDFALYIDWYVRNGALRPGQLKPGDLYTNEYNPY